MQKLFNKILVPVDIRADSSKLLLRIVDISRQFQCNIHLLFIDAPRLYAHFGNFLKAGNVTDNDEQECREKIEKSLSFISRYCRNGSHTYTVSRDKPSRAITDKAGKEKFDLIVVGQDNRLWYPKFQIDPGQIAGETNIPVFVIPTNNEFGKPKSIVIPVTNFLPVKKLIYGIYIAAGYKAKIKLLGIEEIKNNAEVEQYLRKCYAIIRENCSIDIELDMIAGNNISEALYTLGEKEDFNIVILNPEKQDRAQRHSFSFADWLWKRYPSWPVLTVR